MTKDEDRGLYRLAAALIAASLLLGGSGAVAPLQNLAVQLLGLLTLAAASWNPRAIRLTLREKLACFFLGAVAVTPLLQLIPLPPDMLPRGAAPASAGVRWRTISIDPEGTWQAAAYLLPPAALFLAVLRLDEKSCRKLAWIAAAGGLISLLFAALQSASGGTLLQLYGGIHSALPTGLFVNRNHQADLLLIAMILHSALLAARHGGAGRWALRVTLVLAFSAGVLATGSRAGLLLLPIAIIASAFFWSLSFIRRPSLYVWSAGAAALAAAGLLMTSAAARTILDRFAAFHDPRFDYWSEVLFVAGRHLPFGSGAGTFAAAFQQLEDLNRLEAPYLNHAHNDYLEIVVETGVWGGLLVVIFLSGFTLPASRCLKSGIDPLRRAAAVSILILLLHSLGDYPLRTLSLLTLFGFLCGLLVRRGASETALKAK